MNMQNKNRVACCDPAFVRAALKCVGRFCRDTRLTSMNMQNKNRVACCDPALVRAALKYVGRWVGG